MLKKIAIGKWELRIGEDREVPENVLFGLENFLSNQWREAAIADVREIGNGWWAAKELSIPSPIVRVDMAPTSDNPQKFIYEVEVRPAGLGITPSLLPEMKSQWQEVLKGCRCQGLVSLETPVQDDGLAAEVLGMPYFKELPEELLSKGPFWIRTKIDDPRAPILERSSLVPIRMDGYKGYLLKLGLGFSLEDPSSLPWERGFVLKPLQGTWTKGIEIWLPKRQSGTSSRTRILRMIEEIMERCVPYLWQPFIFPKAEEYEGKKGWTIWRSFFGWFGWQEQYRFIGGVWNWRPNLRVHGASDAIMGALKRGKKAGREGDS